MFVRKGQYCVWNMYMYVLVYSVHTLFIGEILGENGNYMAIFGQSCGDWEMEFLGR
jgi:hypothetical protein